MKTVFIIKANKYKYISTCFFKNVGSAMVFAKDLGFKHNEYEIIELTQF